MDEAFIGVDVGTGSARAGVFDADGRLLASAKRPIAIWREPGEIVEHSSRDVWDAASAAVREAVARAGVGSEVRRRPQLRRDLLARGARSRRRFAAGRPQRRSPT